jgi:uncharacterized protein (DUF2267 family)
MRLKIMHPHKFQPLPAGGEMKRTRREDFDPRQCSRAPGGVCWIACRIEPTGQSKPQARAHRRCTRRCPMSGTSIANFTQAAQQAQQWVNELAEDLGWTQPRAYHLLRCVLHALRDWLSPEEMTDLSSQLPVLVRGIYFENWKPLETPVWERRKEDFIARVEDAFPNDAANDPDEAVRAVFRLLDRHISHGEIVQVRNSMRKPLRDLWPAT